MDEVKGVINDGSVGFLSKDGKLKGAAENAEAESKIAANSQRGQSQPTQKSESEEPSVTNALAAVRKRTNEDVSQITAVLNVDRENLADGRANLKQLRGAALELKQAIKNGDAAQIDSLKSKIQTLQVEQDEIAKRVEVDNQRLASERVQDVKVGNRQIGRVKTEEVRFEKSSEAKLDTLENLNAFIEKTELQLGEVKEQLNQNRELRLETKGFAEEARAEINRVEEHSLRNIKDAEELANKVSSQLKQLNTQSLNLVHNNVNKAAVDALFR